MGRFFVMVPMGGMGRFCRHGTHGGGVWVVSPQIVAVHLGLYDSLRDEREPPQINMLGDSCTAPEEKVETLKQDMASLKDQVKTLQQENLKRLKDLKEQRELAFHWQYCCDGLLDQVLCRECQEDKDDAYMMGKGFTWLPEYCSLVDCKLAQVHLHAGLTGYEKELVIPKYWEEDPVLKFLENRWVNASLKAVTLVEEGMEEAMKE